MKNTVRIKGLIPNLQNGFGTLYYSVSLPNDSKGNGIAIVNAEDQVVQFLSWGGEYYISHMPFFNLQVFNRINIWLLILFI